MKVVRRMLEKDLSMGEKTLDEHKDLVAQLVDQVRHTDPIVLGRSVYGPMPPIHHEDRKEGWPSSHAVMHA